MRTYFALSLLVLSVLGTAHAQDGNFDNLTLDGGLGGDPVLTFRQGNGYAYYFSTFDANSFPDEQGYLNYFNASSFPFWIFGTARLYSLTMGQEGVAIGKRNADEMLHVYAKSSGPFFDAQIKVENDLVTRATREMLSLHNNGGSRISFNDSLAGTKWTLSGFDSRFAVSLNSTGGPEMTIGSDGEVAMGPGPVKNLVLSPSGNLTIMGTLTQSSDRNLKTQIQEVDASLVLEKVSKLPVTTWKFIADQPDVRHMGPMAQDFYAAFELGESDTKLAPVDGVGVALAAIQALNSKAMASERRVAELMTELDDLRSIVRQQQQQIETLSEMASAER